MNVVAMNTAAPVNAGRVDTSKGSTIMDASMKRLTGAEPVERTNAMKMKEQVPYVVECKSTYPFFEMIAAFNVDSVALHYMRECAATNPGFSYRVRDVRQEVSRG